MKPPIIEVLNDELYNKVKNFAETIAREENVKVVEIITVQSGDFLFVNKDGLGCIPNKKVMEITTENPAIYIARGEINIQNTIKIEKEEDIEETKTELLRRIRISKVYSKLPRIDCKKCGRNGCYEMAIDIVEGKAKITDCVVLSSKKDVILKVKGNFVFLNPWVMDLFKKTILAMISTLKGVEIKGDEKIYIEVE